MPIPTEKLPILYKPTKTGKVQVCSISFSGDYYTVMFGQQGCKMQLNKTVCMPKNVGRSNQTTPEDQAELEARATFTRKVKSGYSIDPNPVVTVKLPQKVKVFQDQIGNVTFPNYSTPKLDGVNGMYWLLPDGSLKLTSRGGNEYPPIPHLEQDVRSIMKILSTDVLNGELYIHKEHLQNITSAVKKTKNLSKSLEFQVFALPNVDLPFVDVLKLLKSKKSELDKLIVVSFVVSTRCTDIQKLEAHYLLSVTAGFEGTVVYLPESVYRFNERSSTVFKYKKAQDKEFKIASYVIDKRGHPTFICETEGNTFKVRPKGTVSDRLDILANIDEFIGKWYTVEFEQLSRDGIPLKPVGLHLRHCNKEGKPLT